MKISIITATYNSGSTLRDTIESVLAQTYTDIEHIIVDGASNDDTIAIVKEYEPRYDGRLRYISEPDKGIYDAMNKGIAMATGDVIGILNSDDFYTANNIVEKLAISLTDDNVDAVYGDIHFVESDNLNKCVRYYSSAGFRPWKMRMGYMPAHPSFYGKKSIYDKYGSFDTSLKVSSDYELLLRFICVHHITTKYIKLDCVTMRNGGTSTDGLNSNLLILKDIMKSLKINKIYSNYLFQTPRYITKLWEMLVLKIVG